MSTNAPPRSTSVGFRRCSATSGTSKATTSSFGKIADDVYQWLTPITDAGEAASSRLGFRMTEPPEGETGWAVEFRLVGDGDEPAILTAEISGSNRPAR